MLLRNARLTGGGAPVDLQIIDAAVRIRPQAARPDATDREPPGEQVDLGGRFVLPGLWDGHVHFDQWSAARQRLDLAGTASAAAVADRVRTRLAAGSPPDGTVLVGYGFRDGLWPDAPSTRVLDEVSGAVPVVMISADLHAAWFNSAALARIGRPDHPTGLLREQDWFPITGQVVAVPEAVADTWAAQAAEAAAARGVVGIVDFELPDSSRNWMRRIPSGQDRLRVVCSVWPEALETAISRGFRTGDALPGTDGLATMGPLKVITDGSLNTRTAYCDDPYPGLAGLDAYGILAVPPEQLLPLMRRAWSAGLDTAIHAIGDHANSLVLDAFAEVGSRGSVEHAQLLRPGDFRRFAELGVVASVQPEHAVDDRDVADRHWAGRTDRAFAYARLVAAGATLSLGSDAPVAPLDPWPAIAAAIHRSKDDRPRWHPEQEIPVAVALAASSRGRAGVADGDVADLVVVDLDPASADPAQIRTMPVAATLVGGRFTYRSGL